MDFTGLILDSGDWSDLTFLQPVSDRIEELRIDTELCDWPFISNLENLKYLAINGHFDVSWRFSGFKRLIWLDSYWNDGYDDSIFQLKT